MRIHAALLAVLALPSVVSAAPTVPAAPPVERLAADTPKTTVAGNTFIAPAGWSVRVKGPATIVEAPEGDSAIALVDVKADTAEAAVAAGWAAYKPEAKWALKVTNERPDRYGWTRQRAFEYQTSPNERRTVVASARFANGGWLVAIYDVSDPVGEKRGAQISLIFDRLYPKGYTREVFTGKKAHKLDTPRLEEIKAFVETGRKELGIPGVALGLVEDGRVVFSGGFGEKEIGGGAKPDGDTLFMIASNTKALTTLLLAKEVEAKKLGWETPVTSLLPTFKLGDADTTKRVRVRHLICACTGLPRQDLEWIFEFAKNTPEGAMATLGTMQPTSKFGEMFQYSNPMAGAAGFTAGHVLFPDLPIGAAYDKAMQQMVFDPLGMKATTFDYAKALAGNHAFPHAPDEDNKPAEAVMEVNYSILPLRPAGAAWSSVNDMLRYVSMELAEGMLPDGKRYIAKGPLLERRVAQVPTGKDETYGMGLEVDTRWGVPVVHHGGDMIGFHSDMIWIPEAKVGAVILTNADPGWILRTQLRRKLLEVLYDGKSEAAPAVAAGAKTFFEGRSAERKLLTIPAEATESAKLAAHYANAGLGEIAVGRAGAETVFDFGEWKSPMASRKNPDGTISFVTTAPGMDGFEFVVGSGAKKTLVARDAQHEYVFEAK